MGALDLDHTYTDEELAAIEETLRDTGYSYDSRQNIFYSVPDSWQRKMGYTSLYDDWATPLGMVFDCEPVHFDYNGKKWLIEFWKGQYGIASGGEIGIYNTTRPDTDFSGSFQDTFYDCASDDEWLDMAFTLYRGGKPLFTRRDRHWWLTGFVLGEFIDPSELTMEATVTFGDPAMGDAFLNALMGMGYTEDRAVRDGDTVWLKLSDPISTQPPMRHGLLCDLTMHRTKALVDEYRRVTQGCDNMYDVLLRLREEAPLLYELAVGLGRQKSAYSHVDSIGERLDKRL